VSSSDARYRSNILDVSMAVDVSCATTSLHSLRVGCVVWWSLGLPGCVSAGLVFLLADRVGLVPGLTPALTPGSYAAVLSGGDLHKGFVAGSGGRRRLPCIVGLVGDAGVFPPLSHHYLMIYTTVVIYCYNFGLRHFFRKSY